MPNDDEEIFEDGDEATPKKAVVLDEFGEEIVDDEFPVDDEDLLIGGVFGHDDEEI